MQVQTLPTQRTGATLPASTATAAALTPRIDGTAAVPAIAPLAAVVSPPQQAVMDGAASSLPQASSPFLEPGLQEAVSAGQQAQAWLDDLGQKLQGLKTSLTGLLVGGAQPNNTAQALQQFAAAWQQRSDKAGGMVDAQLRVVDPGLARQNFTLRGLDMESLTQEGAENLSFAVPGTSTPVPVAIDPAQRPETSAQRIDQALAPSGVRVSVSAGKLQWNTSEAQWPSLREGLSVKGDGRRFPSGQRVRVRLEAQADAIQPAAWSVDSAQAQRQTLGRVIAAQALLADAGRALDQKVAAARLPEVSVGQGQVLLGLAQDFKDRASQPVYESFASLAPALRTLRKDQVRALLT